MATAPFLKWPGGKRWLVVQHPALLTLKFKRLVEPFAGSAAIFFHLRPESAWLNDSNPELINSFYQVRESWETVYSLLAVYQSLHSKSFYYSMRSMQASDLVERAARFIYLNRTCFNGIYRVNKRGEFNVPKGTKKTVLMPGDDFGAISDLLRAALLTSWDFEHVIDACSEGDLLFVDPPYTVKHNSNGFLKYNEKIFSWADQVRLRDAVSRAKTRGADVVVCNADHSSIRDLYVGSQRIDVLGRQSVIAADKSKRRTTTEVLVRL